MAAVQTMDLIKNFGKKRALDGLSLEIAENRITGLIGRNGAGKTTLLKLIAGFYKPTGGSLSVFGKAPFNNIGVSNNSVFIDDNMAFPQSLNLGEIVREMKRFYAGFDVPLAHKLLDYFGLNEKNKPAALSKGMRSIFFAVIGIAARAPLTVLDEPTTGMDAAVRQDFYRMLLKEYIAFPRTVIISSHLLGELSGLLEDIVLIDSGKLVKTLSADEAGAYAVGLRGPEQAVMKLVGGRQVLHRESFGSGMVFIAAKAPLTGEEQLQARELNVELQPVKAEELCIYLTENGKGGIDDALRRE